MAKKVTIPDIAKASGLSKSTVSLALQDSDKLRKTTREKIQQIARDMGYVYNRAAANLRGQSSNLVGLIVNDLSYSYFSELATSIEKVLADAGYMVVLANTAEDADRLEKIVSSLAEHNASGIILCSSFGTSPDFIESVKARGMAVVHVGRPVKGAKCDFVAVDDQLSAANATRHILAEGGGPVAFLGGNIETETFKLRTAGFKSALKEAGKDDGNAPILPCRMKRKDIFEQTSQLLSDHPGVKGIVCYSDLTAISVISALREQGIEAGEDICISGFDDVIATGDLKPGITTVRVHIDTLGRKAARMLLDRFKNPGGDFISDIIDSELVVRQSSQLKQ